MTVPQKRNWGVVRKALRKYFICFWKQNKFKWFLVKRDQEENLGTAVKTTPTQLLRSYIELKVMVPNEVAMYSDEDELYSFPNPEDDALDVFFISASYFWPLPSSFVFNNSESMPGFDISSSFTCISPSSILTTVDMDGRSFGMSWVQRRLIFRNLVASSTSKFSFNDVSTNLSSSPLSCSTHACKSLFNKFVRALLEIIKMQKWLHSFYSHNNSICYLIGKKKIIM